MRFVLAAVVSLTAAPALQAASPDPYQWCAEYGGSSGATNCYFLTLEQCQWAISGNSSGFCRRNLFYTGGNGDRPEHARRR